MSRLLVTLVFLLAVAVDASAQILLADAKRDRPLYTSVLAFLNDTITATQLEADLRDGPAIDLMFGHVAEGYASLQEGIGVRVAPRMFSAPDNVCASVPHTASLYSRSDRVELRVGRPFPLNDLVIEARDDSGRVLQGVPIAIEVEPVAPPVLNTQSNATPENHLHPLRPGAFRVRARAICAEQPVHVLIPAVVR